MNLEQQDEDIQAYCAQKGYELTHVYRDAGYRGSSKNRPAFQAMLADCQQLPRPFDVIICWKSDRLSRGIYPAAALSEAVDGTGITLECVKDSIDLSTFPLLAAAGKIELENMRDRFQMARRGRAQRGQVFGVVLYGYRRSDDGRPVVVEEEAEIIRRIFKLYLEGNSGERIASLLTQEGIPSPRGGRWHQAGVTSILRNESYIGTGHHLKYRAQIRSAQGKDVRIINTRPEDQWVEIPFPPVVDKRTFQEAALRRRHYRREPRGISAQYDWPLKGILWCGQHDKPYTTSWARGYKGREPYRYYVCSHGDRLSDKYGRCRFHKLRADQAYSALTELVASFLFDPDRICDLTTTAQQKADEKRGHAAESIERHQRKLNDLEKERGRLLVAFRKGYLKEPELDLHMKQVKEQEGYHREELEALQEEDSEAIDIKDVLASLGFVPNDRACNVCRIRYSGADYRARMGDLVVKRDHGQTALWERCSFCGVSEWEMMPAFADTDKLYRAVARITMQEDGRPEVKLKVSDLAEFLESSKNALKVLGVSVSVLSNETTYRRPGLGTPPGPGRGTGGFPPPTPTGAPAPSRRW